MKVIAQMKWTTEKVKQTEIYLLQAKKEEKRALFSLLVATAKVNYYPWFLKLPKVPKVLQKEYFKESNKWFYEGV